MFKDMTEREACPLLNNPGGAENFHKAAFSKVQAAWGEYNDMQKKLADLESQLRNVLAWGSARENIEDVDVADVPVQELIAERDAIQKNGGTNDCTVSHES